jgi:hypothetical protein
MREIRIIVLSWFFPLATLAATWYDGTLIVTAKDVLGNPITNATVVVSAEDEDSAWSNATKYEEFEAMTDANGVATVAFKTWTFDFHWDIYTPNHYNTMYKTQRESLPREDEASDYQKIDPETEEGKAKIAELKALEGSGDVRGFFAKFGPKRVKILTNTFSRAVCFYPQRNPQPMYAYGDAWIKLPQNGSTSETNGEAVVTHFPDFEYDIRKNALLPPYGEGEVADFKGVHYYVQSNGVARSYGWIEFKPGCGAYRGTKTGDPTFLSTYEADTNAVYLPKISYSYHSENNRWVYDERLANGEQYLVMRTRAKLDENGKVVECNYSKILGSVSIGREFGFFESVFNPRVNDPNLENLSAENLARRSSGYTHP